MRCQFGDALLFQDSHFFPLVGLHLVGQGLKAPRLTVSESTTESGLLVSLITVLLHGESELRLYLPVAGHSSCFTAAHSAGAHATLKLIPPLSAPPGQHSRTKCPVLKILGAYTFPSKEELPRLHTTISTQGTRDPVSKKFQINKTKELCTTV